MPIFDSAIFDPLIFDTAAAGVSGTSSVTLAGVTSGAAGIVPETGAGAGTLAGVTQSAAGQVAVRGTSVVTLAGVGGAAAGIVPELGTGVGTLAGVTQAATGLVAVRGSSAITLDGVTQIASGTGPLPILEGNGFAILQGIVQLGAGRVVTPVEPPYDWAPAVDLPASTIIGQALRFMQLAPVARHDPTSELLPALRDAFGDAIDECLAAYDWSFASVLVSLPQAFPALTAESELPTMCMLPGDLVQLREVRPVGTRWRLDGSTLRTSAEAPVTIRYTARITREEALPAAFQTAVALQIALLLGARWAGGAIQPEDLAMLATKTLKQAMRDDTRHASPVRAMPLPDLGYGTADGDWASEAVA